MMKLIGGKEKGRALAAGKGRLPDLSGSVCLGPGPLFGGRGGFQSLQLTSPTIYNVSGYFLFPPFPYSLRFPTQGY